MNHDIVLPNHLVTKYNYNWHLKFSSNHFDERFGVVANIPTKQVVMDSIPTQHFVPTQNNAASANIRIEDLQLYLHRIKSVCAVSTNLRVYSAGDVI
jgi:hypothetical protein